MKWISLVFATVTMAAVGWIVWQLVTRQERRAREREERARADASNAAASSADRDRITDPVTDDDRADSARAPREGL